MNVSRLKDVWNNVLSNELDYGFSHVAFASFGNCVADRTSGPRWVAFFAVVLFSRIRLRFLFLFL